MTSTATGDRYRAANQRLVLAAIANKVLASDPATMASTVEALSRYVTTDFDVTEIVSLAQNLRGMDMENDLYTAMEPTTSEYINETWYERLDETAWKEMMSRVDQGSPPTEEDEVDQATGTVLASAGDGGSASGRTHEGLQACCRSIRYAFGHGGGAQRHPACRDWRAKRPTRFRSWAIRPMRATPAAATIKTPWWCTMTAAKATPPRRSRRRSA